MADEVEVFENAEEHFYQQVREIVSSARNRALRAVNDVMVGAYWEIGRVIVEEEQRGAERAGYGTQLLARLAKRLTAEFGEGFRPSNLRNIRQFYLAFPIRYALRSELTWTHYRLLMRVDNPQARSFYEHESVNANWSTRELERQMNSLLFERLALSRDKEAVKALAAEGQTLNEPSDLIKDPYVLEFVGLSDQLDFLESDLESALISKLEKFLLELGKGFAFMGRQQRLTLDGQHFYVDLVFYNRLTRCFVLIDLKTGKLTHQDLGQMQMYVHYYQRERMLEGKIRLSASFCVPTKTTRLSATPCRKVISRSSPPVTNSTCQPRKNWRGRFSGSGRLSSANSAFSVEKKQSDE